MIAKKQSTFQKFSNVIFAFFMRELKTRFGSTKYGYFWMLVEPLVHILLLSFIFSFLGRSISLNIPFPMFLLISMLPYFLFNHIVTKVMDTIQANKALMSYQPVKMIDPMIARLFIEVIMFITTLIISSLIFKYLGIYVLVDNLLFFLFMIFVLIIFSFSIGLLLAIGKEYFQDLSKIVSMILKPLYFVSGIFYTAEIIPANYREYALYNPILNFIEALRGAYFIELKDNYVNYEYIFLLTIVLFATSLVVYSKNKEIFKVVK
jgi:capsular polysaccharide transport system permease protein